MAEFLTQSLFFSLSTKYFSNKYFLTISLNISMFSRTWYHKWIFSLISIPKMYVFMHIGVKVPKLQRLIYYMISRLTPVLKGSALKAWKATWAFRFLDQHVRVIVCEMRACMTDGCRVRFVPRITVQVGIVHFPYVCVLGYTFC